MRGVIGRRTHWTGGICESQQSFHSYSNIFNRFYRQIFGSLPTNVDEEDVVQLVISTFDILKAQRARKAAARQQAAGGKPTNAPPRPDHNLNAPQLEQPEDDSRTESESKEPASKDSETESESDDPNNQKANTSKNFQAASSWQIQPLRFKVVNTHASATVASTSSSSSAKSRLPVQQVCSSELPRLGERPVQASKQPHARQSQSTQQRHSSPHPGRRSKKKTST
jgi:hypothetical protein